MFLSFCKAIGEKNTTWKRKESKENLGDIGLAAKIGQAGGPRRLQFLRKWSPRGSEVLEKKEVRRKRRGGRENDGVIVVGVTNNKNGRSWRKRVKKRKTGRLPRKQKRTGSLKNRYKEVPEKRKGIGN